jgi:RNA polymerase sigma-70 factor (ECF subfamily)
MSDEQPHNRANPRAGLATSLNLLQRARGRDSAAWERLYSLYRPLVLYWCSRWGVRNEDADDVAQEVFRELSASLPTFRESEPGCTFRGWLRGSTRNRVLMHFRQAGKQAHAAGGSSAQDRLEQVADVHEEDDPPEEISGLYHRALELVRGEFEERTWRMFWRTVIDGQMPATVADESGVSAAAVRQAKSRVLPRLKEEAGDLID